MRSPILRNLVAGVAAIVLSALIASPALAQKTKITVYTALENDQLGPYKEAFEKANPDVEIAWVRDSTGVVTAKILAEKDNPRADISGALARRALRCSTRWDCSSPTRRKMPTS
jgi:iron(III) transport system substrate-binding protein